MRFQVLKFFILLMVIALISFSFSFIHNKVASPSPSSSISSDEVQGRMRMLETYNSNNGSYSILVVDGLEYLVDGKGGIIRLLD